jgi:cytoskeleton protein RodZ
MAEPAGTLDGPGAQMRAARERQGMHIAMLAAALKVPQARLEALEAGRFENLPDATFTRALAQSVCRVLKLDPAPVLAQLPQPRVIGLEKVASGLNTPFRDRPGSAVPAEWTPWRKPALWAAGVLVAGAAAFLLLPPRGVTSMPALDLPPGAASAPAVAASAPQTAASMAAESGAGVPVLASAALAAASAEAPASASAIDPALAAAQGAVLAATQPTWVQAVDGGGQVLVSRLVPAGETLELVGTPPLRIKIGNASGARLRWRGQPLDLMPWTRDNVANVELR